MIRHSFKLNPTDFGRGTTAENAPRLRSDHPEKGAETALISPPYRAAFIENQRQTQPLPGRFPAGFLSISGCRSSADRLRFCALNSSKTAFSQPDGCLKRGDFTVRNAPVRAVFPLSTAHGTCSDRSDFRGRARPKSARTETEMPLSTASPAADIW